VCVCVLPVTDFTPQEQNSVVMTKPMWPAKPKICSV
jgi:hypothetical protein